MPAIFASNPGRLVSLNTRSADTLFTISVAGLSDTTGLITNVNVEQRVSAQVKKTLDRALFVTSFGDDVGSISVQLVHGYACDGRSEHQIKRLHRWYNETKLGTRQLSPVRLAIGDQIYRGHLMSMSLQASADQGSFVRSNLNFIAWAV